MAEKLYSLMVFKWKDVPDKPVMLTGAIDVSSFSILQRNGAKQFVTFYSRTVAGKTQANTRQQFCENEYRVYAHARADGLCAVCCANETYPDRAAFGLISQTLSEFGDAHKGKYEGAQCTADNCITDPNIEKKLKKFQNPAEADQVLKIQRELDDIKTIMMQNLDKVLERGEKIDNLVEQTTDLSSTSKTFYKTAKKTNQGCCVVM